MTNQKLYDAWSATYDEVENKTRDLEKIACRELLSALPFGTVIELGCGTGKNTVWLAEKAKRVIAVDLSEEMQAAAKRKVKSGNVVFKLADVSKPWDLGRVKADLVTCSLILEHVENLDFIFQETRRHLKPGGLFYVCELHPFRQYAGSKARFETEAGLHVLECFTHHISDFAGAALKNGFAVARLDEWFDDGGRAALPRLVSFVFKKAE